MFKNPKYYIKMIYLSSLLINLEKSMSFIYIPYSNFISKFIFVNPIINVVELRLAYPIIILIFSLI